MKSILEVLALVSRAFCSNCEKLIFVHDDNYGLTVDSKKYCQIADPLARDIRACGFEVQIVRYPGSQLLSKHLKNKSFNINIIFAVFYALGFFLTRDKKQAKLISWYLLFKGFGCNVAYAFMPSHFFCRAAKLAGVYVYDLQHGVITPSDPYYQLCFDSSRGSDATPDAILFLYRTSYDFWKNQRLPIEIDHIGSPYLADLPSFPVSANNDQCFHSFSILFTQQADFGLSWGVEGNCDGQWYTCGLPASIVSVLFSFKYPVRLVIRLHPLSQVPISEVMAIFRDIPSWHKVKVVSSRDVPLLTHLAEASLHITNHSAVVFEAAEYGVPSVVLSQSTEIKDQFGHLSMQGLVDFSSNRQGCLLQSLRPHVWAHASSPKNTDFLRRSLEYRTRFLENLRRHLSVIR